jgi:hypothetical protein
MAAVQRVAQQYLNFYKRGSNITGHSTVWEQRTQIITMRKYNLQFTGKRDQCVHPIQSALLWAIQF